MILTGAAAPPALPESLRLAAIVAAVKRVLLAALAAAAALPCTAAAGPLRTAIVALTPDPLVASRIREAGATVVRIGLSWSAVAPAEPPRGFRPEDPGDPSYDWSTIDRQVKFAAAEHLQPLITIDYPPPWAEKDEPHPTHQGPYPIGGWKPDPVKLEVFAHTIATRYSGSFRGLPRVRYWEVWNEPNLSQYLSPQLVNGKVASPQIYRRLVNAFAIGIHDVHADNVVAAGALSAFSFKTPSGRLGISPMLFMRKLLCMSAGAHPKPVCNTPITFDAWSHHPWTSGGPAHRAAEPGDVSLGDLHEMRVLLKAAFRAGHIRTRRMPQFWLTEFNWDTRPPDIHPLAAPIGLQARWISEALYRSWKEGVSLFTWFLLWDEPSEKSVLQGGLFFRNGESLAVAQPKPSFWSFRFPFVAYRNGRRVTVWGRTPAGRAGHVAIQQRTGSKWRWLGALDTDRYGIFAGNLRYRALPKAPKPAALRADPGAYHDLIVSGRPMSYWRLDEKVSPTVHDGINANDGTIVGNVRLGTPGAFAGSTSATFDGSGRIALGRVTSLHTIELWVKTRTLAADVAAFSNRNDQHMYANVGVAAGLAHAVDSYAVWAKPVNDGRWHYLAYTYDTPTSTGRLYVDGKPESYAVFPRTEGGAPASLGFDAYTRTFFKGQIDEVAAYSYPLTAEQIRSHYLASGRRIAPDVAPGMLRAVESRSKASSLPFSLNRPPDRYVLPFGGG
jgi:Concanavalin A-like lectin/glucanases superfamily